MSQEYDLVIVGMGSGGMVAADFAATLGIRVAVVERARVGGDCLWTGCVPSKALLASAKAAHTMRHADAYGLTPVEPEIDTARVWERIRAIQQSIADTDDNAARYEAQGVEVIFGAARIVGPNAVEVDARRLEAPHILLCTGSRPVEPPIEGLSAAGYLTSETVFELARAPATLILIGGGPIAVELAQAFARLGVGTTVLQRGPGILPRDEPELVDSLMEKLRAEGVDLRLNVNAEQVTVEGGRKVVHGTEDGEARTWAAEEILVGAGRRPNIEGLGLEEVDVAVGPHGVKTDDFMRTSVRSIYAVGDLAGRYLFTHSAGVEGVRAVRNMLFPGTAKGTDLVPWCTFTDPELAHAGMTRAEAEERHGADDVEVWRQELTHSDRARTESATEGTVLIVTAKKRVVGAHILAPSAGEMIHELALAIRQEMKLADLGSLTHVYPTLSIAIGQLAGEAAFAGAHRYKWLVRKAKA